MAEPMPKWMEDMLGKSDKLWQLAEKGKKYKPLQTNTEVRKFGVDYYNDPKVLQKLWDNYNYPNVIPYNEPEAQQLAQKIQQKILGVREVLSTEPLFDRKQDVAQYFGGVKDIPMIFYNKDFPIERRQSAVPHEMLGHASKGLQFNRGKMDSILKDSTIEENNPSLSHSEWSYFSNPEEIYAAIKDAQYKILKDKGFPKDHDFTDEDIKQYMEGTNKKSARFFNIIKPELRNQKIKQLLNGIVMNTEDFKGYVKGKNTQKV
jgi:hypothetical protein